MTTENEVAKKPATADTRKKAADPQPQNVADAEATKKQSAVAKAPILVRLALKDVSASVTNPRLNLDKEPFAELKASIKKNGVLQPILVRKNGASHEIVDGHRRFAAVTELLKEDPHDHRFAFVEAVLRDVDDAVMPVFQLVANMTRADLSPLEIGDAVARAMQNGATGDQLAAQLGWTRRNLNRYLQIHDAPQWLKDLGKEVRLQKKKLDADGNALLDQETGKPVLETVRLPGLSFTHLFELVVLFNHLHEADLAFLEKNGGDAFRPTAERTIRKLAALAAVEVWSVAKLRGEVNRAKEPRSAKKNAPSSKHAPVLLLNEAKLQLDVKRLAKMSPAERNELAPKLVEALRHIGFKRVTLSE